MYQLRIRLCCIGAISWKKKLYIEKKIIGPTLNFHSLTDWWSRIPDTVFLRRINLTLISLLNRKMIPMDALMACDCLNVIPTN